MKKKIVFEMFEEQLEKMVWNIKNYGVLPEAEKDVTKREMKLAKGAFESYMQGFEEHLSAVLDDNKEVDHSDNYKQ